MPQIAGNHQKLGKRWFLPQSGTEVTNTDYTLISDFWFPEMWQNKFMLF